MKQEMISYLHTIKEDISNLSKYLYENPEESFYEYKAYNYIIDMLKKNNFRVTEKFLEIPTAFYAEYGSGHPKICYICEYDAMTKEGHIAGHNLISAISMGASLALSKVLDNFDSGTVIVLGCPGEFISGVKTTMSKQGIFNDIDTVLMVHPDVEDAETGTSMAVLPMKIKYIGKEALINSKDGMYSSFDACSFTFNAMNCLKGGFKANCTIDSILIENSESYHTIPKSTEIKFYIRAPKMTEACEIEKKIRELAQAVASLMELEFEVSIPELPYDELIPNHALSRLFAHNLKEVGIIDSMQPKNTYSGLSLGTVSHIVPCIHPYISIAEDTSINYSTIDFAKATVSSYAQDKVLKAASALAMTGLDLLEKEELLLEVKGEFFETIKEHKEKPCVEV
jgi:amidohydrolase